MRIYNKQWHDLVLHLLTTCILTARRWGNNFIHENNWWEYFIFSDFYKYMWL